MGAGKTVVGQQLANYLVGKFYDSDVEITRQSNLTISDFFNRYGEPRFRLLEGQVLKQLTNSTISQQIVLATGGGAVLSSANRAVISNFGLVVYLKTSIIEQYQRTQYAANRPLLQGSNDDCLATLTQLMAIRGPLYEQIADIAINTDNHSIEQVVSYISNMIC